MELLALEPRLKLMFLCFNLLFLISTSGEVALLDGEVALFEDKHGDLAFAVLVLPPLSSMEQWCLFKSAFLRLVSLLNLRKKVSLDF